MPALPTSPLLAGRCWLLLLLWLLVGPAGRAQALRPVPRWQQAAALGRQVRLDALAANPAGDVYVAGSLASQGMLGAIQLPAAPDDVVFVAKWNGTTHRYGWVLPLSTFQQLSLTHLAANGRALYLTGYFSGQLRLGDTTLTAGPASATVIIKVVDEGSSGRIGWVKLLTTQTASDRGANVQGIATSGSSLYLAGYFGGTIRAGGLALGSVGSQHNLFVLKLTDAGKRGRFVWGRQASSPDDLETIVLAVADTSVYVAGGFRRAATFGPLALRGADSGRDAFLARLHDAGPTAAFRWVERLGNGGYCTVDALAAAGDSLYLAGSSDSYTKLGSNALAATGRQTFLLKLRDEGTAVARVWRQQLESSGLASIHSLALRPATLYLAGSFTETCFFDRQAVTAAGHRDVYLTQLADQGQHGYFNWVQRLGGQGELSLGESRLLLLAAGGSHTLYLAASLPPLATLGRRRIAGKAAAAGYLLRFGLP